MRFDPYDGSGGKHASFSATLRPLPLAFIDYAVIGAYFAAVLGIGVVLKRRMRASLDFLLAGRAIPAWAAGLAFIAANLGAQEVIGMAASGAKYGWLTSHFYWLGP
jgi:SSS family solute:Na+ symporter